MSDGDNAEKISVENDSTLKGQSITLDLSKLKTVNTTAINNLKNIQENAIIMLKPLMEAQKKLQLAVSPQLIKSAQELAKITISPSELLTDLNGLSSADIRPEIVRSLNKESLIIEKQNETIDLLKTVLEQQKELFEHQRKLLHEIFKIVRELKEEQRLEHSYVDKLYQMALEWGVGEVEPDKDLR